MDRSLLEQPLVSAPSTIRAACSADDAARLRALPPDDYWLAIAAELAWVEWPSTGLDGRLGNFRYFPGATGNVSVNYLDRCPVDLVALHYEREDGATETWTYGRLTDAVARFAAALRDLGVAKGDRVVVYASNVPSHSSRSMRAAPAMISSAATTRPSSCSCRSSVSRSIPTPGSGRATASVRVRCT